MRFGILLLLVSIAFLLLPANALPAHSAKMYLNEACGHCGVYANELKEFLSSKGIDAEIEYVINNPEIRAELDALNKRLAIPPSMQGHMTVSIDDKLVLEGHIPIALLEGLFGKYPELVFPPLIVLQDSMDASAITSYRVLGADGKIRECSVDVEIANCANSGKIIDSLQASLPYVVLTTGLLAGLHPCTIAVLLFFIAFLFTIRRTRIGIFKVGGAYILGIFLAYLLIGLGLLQAFVVSAEPHFFAKIAGIFVIGLGLLNIVDFFKKGKLVNLGLPKASLQTIKDLIHKASVPSAFVLGILVGICSFGCTAGIYISILGLLVTRATYMEGLFYLLVYNLLFILPLIFILFIASSRKVVERIETWEQHEKNYIKLIAGLSMIILGALLLMLVY